MLNSLLSFFNNSLDDHMLELRKPNAKNFIYRDELISKKPFSKKKKMDGTTFVENSEPLIKRESKNGKLCGERSSYRCAAEEKGGVIRVTVKMTKQEAARMLSKCKNGGVLEFKDVAFELTQIPTDRVRVGPSPAATFCAAGSVLKTIHEEF